jgi:pimeloyl-ACP methyl ester carboxylesterase
MATMEMQIPGLNLPPKRFIFGEECWAEVAGHRMRYLRAGSGPPLVLVHGLMGYSFSFRRNMEALSRKFTVYAIDLPGIGYSERPPRGMKFDMRTMAGRLLDWMAQTGISDADLLGTSHGGAITIFMTALDQEQGRGLIQRLVLVAPANPWSRVGRKRIRVFGNPVGAFCMRSFQPALAMLRGWAIARMYGDPAKVTDDTRAGYDAPLRIRGTVDYLLSIVQYWRRDMVEFERAISRIAEMPILLMWGTRDLVVPLPSGRELHKCLPHAELVVLEGAGHLPYEEAPEEFNRALLQYLG